MTLRELQPGKTATILSVGGEGALRQHLLDMGLIQGTEVTVVKYAPMGDPVELRIHGYELTIRLDDADKIMISKPHEAKWHPECKPFKDQKLIRATVKVENIIIRKKNMSFRQELH